MIRFLHSTEIPWRSSLEKYENMLWQYTMDATERKKEHQKRQFTKTYEGNEGTLIANYESQHPAGTKGNPDFRIELREEHVHTMKVRAVREFGFSAGDEETSSGRKCSRWSLVCAHGSSPRRRWRCSRAAVIL